MCLLGGVQVSGSARMALVFSLLALIRFPLAGAVEGEMRLGLFEAILMDRSCPVARRCSVLL